jgi:hypothetical protein
MTCLVSGPPPWEIMAKAVKMFLQNRKTDITKQRFKVIEVY